MAAAPKRGFPVPLADWLRQEPYYVRVHAAFASAAAEQFFDTQALCTLLDDKKTNAMTKIWAFYCFFRVV